MAVVAVVVFVIAAILAMLLLHEAVAALMWGAVAAIIVVGWDPVLFFGLAAGFLVLPPLFLVFNEPVIAERLAETAFALLALAVVLELRRAVPRRLVRRTTATTPGAVDGFLDP